MGVIWVEVEIGSKSWKKVRALVDSGFMGDLIISPRLASEINLDAPHRRKRVIADGKEVEVSWGIGLIKLGEDMAGVEIEVMEGLPAEALLGVTALEKLGYIIDPRTGELKKTPMYLL